MQTLNKTNKPVFVGVHFINYNRQWNIDNHNSMNNINPNKDQHQQLCQRNKFAIIDTCKR